MKTATVDFGANILLYGGLGTGAWKGVDWSTIEIQDALMFSVALLGVIIGGLGKYYSLKLREKELDFEIMKDKRDQEGK